MGDCARHIPFLSRRSGACRLAAAAVLFVAIGAPAIAQEATVEPPEAALPPAVASPTPPFDPDARPLGLSRSPLPRPRDGAGAAPHTDSSSIGLVRTGVSLAFVLSLAVLAAVVVRRFSRAKGGLAAAFGPGGPAPAGVLEILGRYPVSRGQTLILLRAHNRILLLAHAAGAPASAEPVPAE